MVQTTKEALSCITKGEWKTWLTCFLISQHVTPNSSTEKVLLCCLLISDWPLPWIVCILTMKVICTANRSGMLKNALARSESLNQMTWCTWEVTPGNLSGYLESSEDVTGPLSYKVRTGDGQMHRHVYQLLDRAAPLADPSRPMPNGYTVPLSEPSVAEMLELQPPTVDDNWWQLYWSWGHVWVSSFLDVPHKREGFQILWTGKKGIM